jgi:hypothetical protein
MLSKHLDASTFLKIDYESTSRFKTEYSMDTMGLAPRVQLKINLPARFLLVVFAMFLRYHININWLILASYLSRDSLRNALQYIVISIRQSRPL